LKSDLQFRKNIKKKLFFQKKLYFCIQKK